MTDRREPGYDPRLAAAQQLARDVMGPGPPLTRRPTRQGAGPGGREPGYRYAHGLRVARLAVALADAEGIRPGPGYDPVLTQVGALLHDVGKALAAPGDHADAGAAWCREHLGTWFAPAEVERIAAIVARHNKREPARAPGSDTAAHPPPAAPPEVRLVQDADLLDHFGAMEIWLGAYAAASARETLEEALAVFTGPDGAGWRRYALTHAAYPTTRRLLEERVAYADRFLARLAAEAAGRLRPPEA